MGNRTRSVSKAGFTLVELLVVIGIIAVLIAILMPALRSARESANTIACASNMRQIGMGLTMYVTEFDGYVPVSDWRGNSGINWAGILVGTSCLKAPLTRNTTVPDVQTSVLMCPSGYTDAFSTNAPVSSTDPDGARPYSCVVPGLTGSYQRVNVWYGYNACSSINFGSPAWRVAPDNDTSNWNCGPKFSQITKPAQTVAVFDGCSPVNPFNNWRINARHNFSTSTNLLFWDGHVETVPTKTLPPPEPVMNWNPTNLNNLNRDICWLTTQ